MSTCEECGEGIEAIPYECSTCSKILCPEHRLSEKHNCEPRVHPSGVSR